MDVLVSSFSVSGTKEAGFLLLVWAVFVCLLLSLPDRAEYSLLMVHCQRNMRACKHLCVFPLNKVHTCKLTQTFVSFQEIDHIAYLCQAFEASPFNYVLGILCSDAFKDSDVSLPCLKSLGFMLIYLPPCALCVTSYPLSV